MAQENVLKISEMIAGLDAERMADLLMQQNPDIDPTQFEAAPAAAQQQQQNPFLSALATPDSGLQTPQQQLPAPRLFGFGNSPSMKVIDQRTGAPQVKFPTLFGG